MIEIRIHGRGGQGNVVAAYLMASAAFEAGRYCQAFPAFGAERRGAPVQAYVRIDDQPILRRDAVRAPGFLVVQDATLLHDPLLAEGLAEPGRVLVNSERPGHELGLEHGMDMVTIPASRMARTHVGRALPNVALLSALLSLTQMLPRESLLKALEGRFSGEVLRKNQSLVDEAMDSVSAGSWREGIHATGT